MTKFYIASLMNTRSQNEHITFWSHNGCGYTCVVSEHIVEYTEDQAAQLNDGIYVIAVPVDAVKKIGPVVDNTRKNWNALIAASLSQGRRAKPKPTVFRGKRRAIYTE